jgi:hypothetical protein
MCLLRLKLLSMLLMSKGMVNQLRGDTKPRKALLIMARDESEIIQPVRTTKKPRRRNCLHVTDEAMQKAG